LKVESNLVRAMYKKVEEVVFLERWVETTSVSKFYNSSVTSPTAELVLIHTCEPFLSGVGSLQRSKTSCLTIQQNSQLSLQNMAYGNPGKCDRLLCSCCVILLLFLGCQSIHFLQLVFCLTLDYFSSVFSY
jgi:hypothetical protein